MPESLYPPLQTAIGAGLFHPGCTHTLGAYIPGLTRPFDSTENPEGYAQRQEQRAMERQIRKWKRKAVAAQAVGDDTTARFARGKARAWGEKLQEFVDSTGRRRAPHRESLMRGKPYAKPPASAGTYDPRKTLSEAQDWARKHGVYNVTHDADVAALEACNLIYGDRSPDSQRLRSKILNRRLDPLMNVDEDEQLIAQNVVNGLYANPLWRDIEKLHGATYVIPVHSGDRVTPIGGDGMRSPIAIMANVRGKGVWAGDLEPRPGDEDIADSGGLGAEVRKAYGKNLLERGAFSPDMYSRYLSKLPPQSQLREELIENAIDDPMETFGDIFATVTNPKYDPKNYAPWVEDMRKDMLGDLGVKLPDAPAGARKPKEDPKPKRLTPEEELTALGVKIKRGSIGAEDIPKDEDYDTALIAYREALRHYERYGIKVGKPLGDSGHGFGTDIQVVDDPTVEYFGLNMSTHTVRVNTAYLKDAPDMWDGDAKSEERGEFRMFATRDLPEVWVHELGRQIHNSLTQKEYMQWNKIYKEMSSLDAPSAYAQENALELFAESVTMVITGRKLKDPKVEKMIRKFLERMKD